jgi:hypothetical protein
LVVLNIDGSKKTSQEAIEKTVRVCFVQRSNTESNGASMVCSELSIVQGNSEVIELFFFITKESSCVRMKYGTWIAYLSSPVSLLRSFAIPPIACLAFLGIVNEFIMSPRFSETPSIKGRVWNASPFVSYETFTMKQQF